MFQVHNNLPVLNVVVSQQNIRVFFLTQNFFDTLDCILILLFLPPIIVGQGLLLCLTISRNMVTFTALIIQKIRTGLSEIHPFVT